MNYNKDYYYRWAYGIMLIFLIPFCVLIKASVIVIFTAIIIGVEYSYIFPRQAMKLYENILFKSCNEEINLFLKIIVFISFSAAEIYYFITNTTTPLFVCIFIYVLYYLIFQRNTIIIGNKNIIIGRKLISQDIVQSISIDNKKILIETMGQSFEIRNWIINNQKNKLERVVKELNDKT